MIILLYILVASLSHLKNILPFPVHRISGGMKSLRFAYLYAMNSTKIWNHVPDLALHMGMMTYGKYANIHD